MLITISVLACLILVVGILNRRRRAVHIPLMLGAFAIDLGLVLYIELTRHVVETLPTRMTPLLGVHIAFAVATLVLYVVMLVTGINNARNRPSRFHPKAAVAFCVVRLGNLLTSLLVT